MNKLTYDDLKDSFDFHFSSLSEATPADVGTLQPRVEKTFARLVSPANLGKSKVLLLQGYPGVDYQDVVFRLIESSGCLKAKRPIFDLCYAENMDNPLRPLCITLKSGSGTEFCDYLTELLQSLLKHVDSEKLVEKILRKQPDNPKLANYLAKLAAHVVKEQPFTNEVIMNLMVAREDGRIPVIYGRDINWHSLFGKVNYLSEQGTVYSHQNLLEPGLLRIANGGYLILPLSELNRQPLLWYKLANVLEEGTLDWSGNYQDSPNIVPFFEPEPTAINLSVVLVGDYIDMVEFFNLDSDSIESIDLKASLSETLDTEKTDFFVGYLETLRRKHGLLDFSRGAVERICRHAQRSCGTKAEYMIVETRLASLMKLSHDIALEKDHELIGESDVTDAEREIEFRMNHIVEESSKLYKDKQILIETSGEAVGQINGMSVVSSSGTTFEYGEPLRITATVHAGSDGDGDISDVEHKANLAGQIHQKAMMIINGYLTNHFAQYEPLPFCVNLVFEQSYSEIDGDSASLSGLCAVLSALSEAPINQSLAVTGALDQFGHVQPVGGLNEKIEGFYRVCKIQGLTGKQGVIIPSSNVKHLILSDEVMDAIKNGTFSIHTVDTLEETIELLTGIKAGSIDEEGTLFEKIQERIERMNGKTGTSLWSRLFGQ